MKPDTTDEFPPLIFRCRWQYHTGSYCSVPVAPPERLCGKHQVEDRDRLATLRAARKVNVDA